MSSIFLRRQATPFVEIPRRYGTRAGLRSPGRIPSRRLRPWIECLEDRTVAASGVLLSIAVAPANPTIAAGTTEQFTARGFFSDQTGQDISGQVVWSSTNTAVATISNGPGAPGLATGVSAGTTTISALLRSVTGQSMTGSTTLTITAAAALQSITVTPADPSIPDGATEQFTATGTYTDNSTHDLTSQVTWKTSDDGVATISNIQGSQGLATARHAGTSTISAALSGVSGSTALTVTAVAALQSIAVTPDNPSIGNGTTDQFTATGTYTDGSTQNLTNQVTWASASTGVATISNVQGSQGLATAVSAGTSTISATLSGISGSTVLTVNALALLSIDVTRANPTINKGTTEQFTATGRFSDQSTQDLTNQVTWDSSSTGVATISNAQGSQGRATGAGLGTATISATLGGVSGSTVLTVTTAALQSIAVTPAKAKIAKGTSEAFTATGTYTDGSTQDLTNEVTWASASTKVATISDTAQSHGVANGRSVGTSRISATFGGIVGSTVLTVTAAKLQSIAVTPTAPSIRKGTTEQFTATGTFSDRSTRDLTNQVTWASTDTQAATISDAAGSRGLATGVSAGRSTISATLNHVIGSTVLTVTPAPTKLPTPTITGESVVLEYPRHGKRGKPLGRPTLGFVLDFSKKTPMNPDTAGNANNYHVDFMKTKRGKDGTIVSTLVPAGFTASFDAATNSVTLTTTVCPGRFTKGGEIIIDGAPLAGVTSASGVFLTGPNRFTVLPGGRPVPSTS